MSRQPWVQTQREVIIHSVTLTLPAGLQVVCAHRHLCKALYTPEQIGIHLKGSRLTQYFCHELLHKHWLKHGRTSAHLKLNRICWINAPDHDWNPQHHI